MGIATLDPARPGSALRICVSCGEFIAHQLPESPPRCDPMPRQHRKHRLDAPSRFTLAPAKPRRT
jgi:hypothetical protein